MAGQHLPRRRVRRPQPALLLLLRPQPRLVAVVLAPARDPRLPAAGGPRVRRARPGLLRHHAGGGDGTTSRRSAGGCAPAGARSPPPRSSPGPAASRSRGCPRSTASTTSRARSSTPRGGTTTSTSAGLRVAVIGTGASSIQIVPEDREGGRPPRRLPAHRAVRHPAQRPPLHPARAASASATCRPCRRPTARRPTGRRESYVPAFTWQPRLAAPARKAALLNIARGIPDPDLRAKVTPDYAIGCKRILLSNTYYPALARDHVDLVTDPIAKDHRRRRGHRRRRRAPGRRDRRGHRLPHHRATDRRAHPRPRGALAVAGVGRHRDGVVQGHDHPRLPQPLPARRRQHRAGPLLDGLHDREPDRLRARRDRVHEGQPVRRHRAAPRRPGRLEPRPPAPHAAHRVVDRRLLQLVPRRPRPQHDAVAARHLHLPLPALPLRRRRVRRRGRPLRREDPTC